MRRPKRLRLNVPVKDDYAKLGEDSGKLFIYFLRQPATLRQASADLGIPLRRLQKLLVDKFFNRFIFKMKRDRCQVTGEMSDYYTSLESESEETTKNRKGRNE